MNARPPTIYEFGLFRLDLAERLLQCKNQPVSLTPKAFEVLTLLIERRGHLVEKGELMREVWADAFVEEANLSRTIWMLRRALADDHNGNGFIQTIPKYGYRFVANVKEISAPSTIVNTGSNTSLAVLPLVNLSGNSSEEYLADGVTEGLIACISRLRDLRVIAPKSVMLYKGTSKTLLQIASELNVDAILSGSFKLDGQNISVSAQLKFPKTDEKLWSENFTRNWCGILYLQRDIAHAIARQIGVEMQPPANDAREINPESYELFLKAHFRLLKERNEETNEAITLLEQAVKLDPDFALGFAELARAYNRGAYYFAPEEKQWREKAFIAVEQANRLNPDLPEAHLARGLLLWTHDNHFPHEQAITEYKRAIELNPNFDEARHQLGLVYHHIGLCDRACAQYQIASSINPVNNLIRLHLAGPLRAQQKYEEALTLLSSIPDGISPIWYYAKASILCDVTRFDEAKAVMEAGLRANPQDEGGLMNAMGGLLAAHDADELKAEQYISQAIKLGHNFGHFHHSAYIIAEAYSTMKKPEEAMKWLVFTVNDGFPCYPIFDKDPDLDNLRQNPDFVKFMAKQKEVWEIRLASL
jgi:Predicted integral membrane protein